MQSQNELRNLLQRIDHKSYPAYKDTRGSYDFGNYVLSIDHVQGDPFAAPSKVSVHVRGTAAKFPADLGGNLSACLSRQKAPERADFWR